MVSLSNLDKSSFFVFLGNKISCLEPKEMVSRPKLSKDSQMYFNSPGDKTPPFTITLFN